MSKPICRAQADVTESNLQRVQREANETFTEAHPILDRELLKASQMEERRKAMAKIVGRGGMKYNELASWIMRKMDTRGMTQWRTHVNIKRLLRSDRVETSQLVELFKLSVNTETLQPFRDQAKQVLLGAQLFFYEHIPSQGSAWCFFPLNI